jgi:hypothetical protein
VFHLKEGFVVRVDDHQDFVKFVDILVKSIKNKRPARETEEDENRCVSHLVQMFWPGYSFLTFCDETGTWLHSLPRFHTKRIEVGLGKLINTVVLVNLFISSIFNFRVFRPCLAECHRRQLPQKSLKKETTVRP